jgi:ribosomal protein S27AE
MSKGIESRVQKMICPACGVEMNYHADKLDYTSTLTKPDKIDPELGGVLEEVHTCPKCGGTEVRIKT